MKKKHPEHVNLERWLVSYADFMTLLFAFFVVMYGISEASKSKFSKVAASLRASFGQSGPLGMIELGGITGGATMNQFTHADLAGGRILNLPAGKIHTASDPDPELQEIRELLEETISLELGATTVAESLRWQWDSRGLVVQIAIKDFFDEGVVQVQPDLQPLLQRIGTVLSQTKRAIRIEGHTDIHEFSRVAKNQKGIQGDNPSLNFESWKLSAARAAWVAQDWVHRFHFNPAQITVSGYAHFHPISGGAHAWQQAQNRRLEFIILNHAVP